MVVLLTDFGQSEYVGIVKGVVYSICPAATVVDLCHEISPQSVIEGAWVLGSSVRYFPAGSVFCCVVDPGVGTQRRALAVKAGGYYFVGPDNGLLWAAVSGLEPMEIREIEVPAGASKTFQGRDVFARVAARIENGGFEAVGRPVEAMKKFEFYRDGREGMVVRIDRFGNVVTNLPPSDQDQYRVTVGPHDGMLNFRETYDAAREGELFVIEGSCKTLELSVKNGSANDALKVAVGEKIQIT